ncbi:hemerythrin domain-containing protein [Streptomyces sp. p1417]|uniref:Hemerythrin domain-containing protein n=1 Tax=Streptomyces typhae TaxID=2681492 RepID=A0A6L6XAF0_9ACTN|nr:hemerythrin domain-containing protein [Streptomyces typhae]MVO90440.1 hemerythrin domain-containing protein [Streptomyces typhae]
MSSTDNDLSSTGPRLRDQPPGRVDFTMMFLTHDAFLRDLRRLEAAVAAGRSGERAVRNGWETIKEELHIHHVGEDEAIWPPLREALSASTDLAVRAELGVLDLMEEEHGRIDPLQTRVDAAFAAGGEELELAVKEFATAMASHMEHEEDQALPLVEQHLGPEGWARYHQFMIGTNGPDRVGAYLAWLLDDVPEATLEKILGMLPPPVRAAYRQKFEPEYRAVPRWTAPTA